MIFLDYNFTCPLKQINDFKGKRERERDRAEIHTALWGDIRSIGQGSKLSPLLQVNE